MAEYSSGSVTVVVGSQTVTGSDTRWDLYVSAGNIIRVGNDSAFYDIANVVSSQQLTLTARYANSTYETNRASEHLATITAATRVYSGTLNYTPAIRSTLTITASNITWEDNGAGVLATTSGAGAGKAGTLDYDAGSWAVSVNSTANIVNANFVASYHTGDTLAGQSYQIIRDYTPNYDLPEIGENDLNTSYTVTKALRRVDSAIYNATINTATANTLKIRANGRIQLGAHQFIFFGGYNTMASVVAAATDIDASVKGSMYISSAGSFWKFTSDTVATKF